MSIATIANDIRHEFDTGASRSLSYRRAQLLLLLELLSNEKSNIAEAIHKDLRRPLNQSLLFLQQLKSKVVDAIDNLHVWAATERPSVPWHQKFDENEIRKFPVGVVLIISPWNYPLLLVIDPLIGAIAAGFSLFLFLNNFLGCGAVLKPSEHSPHFSELLSRLIPKYLDSKFYKVVLGAIPEATQLLSQKYAFITTSTIEKFISFIILK